MNRYLQGMAIMAMVFAGVPTKVFAAETLKLCTGSPGKTYYAVGQKMAELVPQMAGGQLEIEVIATEGSIDNLTRMVQGDCDAAIVQGDAVEFFTTQVRQEAKGRFRMLAPLYKELSLLICSRQSGVGEIEELPKMKGATVAAGPMGSGSLATWLTFRTIQPKYKSVKVLPENGAAGALAVTRGEATCLFEVIAPQSDFIESLNANKQLGGALMFAEVDDGFDGYKVNGQPVYTRVEFDDEKYPNISTWGDPELIAITAYLVLDDAWAKNHGATMSALSMAVLTGQTDIEKVAYGDQKSFEE
jgi:TRAP-type uncharacterized transport system substrate-binding protein